MADNNFVEICDTKGCRIDSPYDVLKIRYTDEGIKLIPVKLKRGMTNAEDTGRIDIKMYSDYSCPWCMLAYAVIRSMGKRFDIHIEHTGFEIHPEAGLKREIISSDACLENTVRRINNRGSQYGIRITDRLFSVNTHKALLAGEHARAKGLHNEYAEAMWDAYLVKGIDIGDPEEIIKISETIGIPACETENAMASQEYEKRLLDNRKETERYHINAVPAFIINDRYLVTGAEDESFFELVFERL